MCGTENKLQDPLTHQKGAKGGFRGHHDMTLRALGLGWERLAYRQLLCVTVDNTQDWGHPTLCPEQ